MSHVKQSWPCVACGALIVSLSWARSTPPTPPGTSSPPATTQGAIAKVSHAVADNTRFGLDLYKRLATDHGNLFFSPQSISTALALTSAGAKGETLTQMATAMRFSLPPHELHPSVHALSEALRPSKDGVELHIANRLWGQQGKPFLPEFLNLAKAHYGGGFETVDFTSDSAVEIGRAHV